MLVIEKYTDQYYDQWNKLVDKSNNGTIFHRLDFLSYHKDRFKQNAHHLVFVKGAELFAVLPLGLFHEKEELIARSPFGSSFGGWVFNDVLSYVEYKEVIRLTIEYLTNIRVSELWITFPPLCYHKKYSETLKLCLFESGFSFVNFDICSVIPKISSSIEFNSRVKRNIKKALQNGINIEFRALIEDFWSVLTKNFEKINKSSTHTIAEWKSLYSMFPESFFCSVAYYNQIPIAGLGHIIPKQGVLESFYICSDPQYKETQALTFLLSESIKTFGETGTEYYDLGTSSANMIASLGIIEFKESFGAFGYGRETFKIRLKNKNGMG